MTLIPTHPYADLFPLLVGEELDRLAGDIKQNGLHHPIILYDGKVLDGRNRYRACELAGIEPRFEKFTGTDEEALALVVSLNLTRRHLSTAQKAAVAVALLPAEQELAQQRMFAGTTDPTQNFGEGSYPSRKAGESTERAGQKVGVSGETVRQAVKIKDHAPEVFTAMNSGLIRSMPEAIKLAKLPEGQRAEILDLVAGQKVRVKDALVLHRKQSSAADQRIRKNKPTRINHPAYQLVYGQHVLDSLKELPDRSVHVVCTSPPYWGVQGFGTSPVVWGGNPECQHDWEPLETNKPTIPIEERRLDGNALCRRCGAWSGQLGQEYDPQLYVSHLVDVFREIGRILRDDGTVWLNLGDVYSTSLVRSRAQNGRLSANLGKLRKNNLMGMPWRVALALQDDGWDLRSDIIWEKENIQPESKMSRPTLNHEYVFLLSKSPGYYYDQYAVLEPWADSEVFRKALSRNGKAALAGRFRRSVWSINTRHRPGARFAWPPELVELMILAGTSDYGVCPTCGAPWKRIVERPVMPPSPGHFDLHDENLFHEQGIEKSGLSTKKLDRWWKEHPPMMKGWVPGCDCKKNDASGRSVVLDPFSGSGTTGMVALQHGRNYIGLDLNESYLDLAKKRIEDGVKRNR